MPRVAQQILMIWRYRHFVIVRAIDLSPNELRDEIVRSEYPIHQHSEPEKLVIIDADEDHAIIGKQFLGQHQPPVHELQPQRMTEAVCLVHKAVVVDEVTVAGVVRRIDVDAADCAFVTEAQRAQRVEIVALNDQVLPWRCTVAQRRVQIQRHVILVERLIGLDLVALPHQPQLALGVAPLQQPDQGFAVQVVVAGHQESVLAGDTYCCGS